MQKKYKIGGALGFIFLFFLLQFAVRYSTAKDVPEEKIPEPELYFCPQDDCGKAVETEIRGARDTVHCAFYDLKLASIIKALAESKADVKVVVDDKHFDKIKDLGFVRRDNKKQLMHNKFCVIDGGTIITGSFNPTENGNYLNNNNMIIIRSKYLAENYEDEFKELWNRMFGQGKSVANPEVRLNGKMFENYFCPEDHCEDRVIETLQKAKKSIKFMTFAFTSKNIAEHLAGRKDIEVEGVIEKGQNNKWSQYKFLEESGVDVKLDKNKNNMHHKVFIIDDSIVVMGSYNPTQSGDSRNDENILIIHDEDIVAKYLEEFERVR